MEYKLKKTDSGTDWEAYQVIKSDTARYIEDDIYSQVTTSTGDREVRPFDSRNQKELPSDIINHIKQTLVEIQCDIVLDRPKDAFLKCAELYRELDEEKK